jgi:exodeoxyribonuclease VII large subunit
MNLKGCIRAVAELVLSVSQLNDYAANLLRRDFLLKNISVKGEISGYKRYTSGHAYFSLKDEASVISCVMFKPDSFGLGFKPSNGMSVTARGYVSIYTQEGRYQLYVKEMEQQGEGELYVRFMRLKEKLSKEGLFDESHKKPLPALPRCIGVVTSEMGAVYSDIKNVVTRRFPKMNILLCPTAVQGEGAAAQIAAAIRRMDKLKLADVLIVCRGGGSVEDLWPFNDEDVARAIYDCSIPVVSAVGHETDYSISDFAADMRAPTPSAAAELCTPEMESIMASLSAAQSNMTKAVKSKISERQARVSSITSSHAVMIPVYRIDAGRQNLSARIDSIDGAVNLRLRNGRSRARGIAAPHVKMDIMHAIYKQQDRSDGNIKALRNGMDSSMDNLRNRMQGIAESLRLCGPENVLRRGFAMIRSKGGDYLYSTDDLTTGERIELIMRDGTAEAEIKNKEG